jgi:hypothetical protein
MNNVDHMKQMIQLMESAVATADDNEALIPDQEWEAWANSYVQRAKAVLPKDRVLNPKNKQTLATVIQKVEQKTQTKSTDMPLWGRPHDDSKQSKCGGRDHRCSSGRQRR